jgi:site-specific recombinase XerD
MSQDMMTRKRLHMHPAKGRKDWFVLVCERALASLENYPAEARARTMPLGRSSRPSKARRASLSRRQLHGCVINSPIMAINVDS